MEAGGEESNNSDSILWTSRDRRTVQFGAKTGPTECLLAHYSYAASDIFHGSRVSSFWPD